MLWFAYYRETRTIPQLMTTFTVSLADIQKDHTAVVQSMQASFEARQRTLLQTFTDLTREERVTCQKWHEENREGIARILEETKENRHLVRDLAHVAGLRKALEDHDADAEAKRVRGQ